MIAELMCDDLDLPVTLFQPAIAQSIRQQIDSTIIPEPIPQEQVSPCWP